MKSPEADCTRQIKIQQKTVIIVENSTSPQAEKPTPYLKHHATAIKKSTTINKWRKKYSGHR